MDLPEEYDLRGTSMQLEPSEQGNQGDLGYEYEYVTNTHLLMPLEFRSWRSGRPIDITKIKGANRTQR